MITPSAFCGNKRKMFPYNLFILSIELLDEKKVRVIIFCTFVENMKFILLILTCKNVVIKI